ncbi:MAG: PQQ-binding-like beta-propeller repeat protein [Verrucomicrobiales bacterium]
MKQKSLCRNLICSLVALLPPSTHAAEAGSWNQFRGPGGSGIADGCRPPVEIGETNLAWKVPIPAGLSAPALSDSRIFLTAVEEGRLVTLAFEKSSGQLAWRKEAPEVPLERVHETSSPATPTPLVDGERVYVYFGSFGLICYDHDGNQQWQKAIPTPKSLYGMATSPIAHGENLILVLDSDENLPDSKLSQSKIIALKKEDGELAWEIPRPFHRSGWSVPTVWEHDGGSELVVLGNGRVSGYDMSSGAQIWFAGGFSRETIAIPVAGGGKIYASAAMLGGSGDENPEPEPFWDAVMQFDKNSDGKLERGEMTAGFTFPLRPELPIGHPGFGIPLPEEGARREKRLDGMFGWIDKDRDGFWGRDEFVANMTGNRGKPMLVAILPGGKGDVSESHVEWQLHRGIPEIPSPIYFDDHVYLVRKGGLVNAIDSSDGSVIYRERLAGAPGQYSASPVIADGHLYLVSGLGVISVVPVGDDFELAHQYPLGEAVQVTPAIDLRSIYIRGEKHLWAFRRPG